MFIKKFEAPSLEQALQQIKQELGSHALILSTEQKKKKWFQPSMIEVTAAFEQKSEQKKEAAMNEEQLMEIFPHRRFQSDDRDLYRSAAKGKKEKPIAPALRGRIQQALGEMASEAEIPAEGDLKSVRKTALNRYMDLTSSQSLYSSNRYEEGFMRMGLHPDSARDLAQQLVLDYPKRDLNNPAFLEKARRKLISPALQVVTPEVFENHASWAAIGSAGAGKTSLLVKLALFLKGQDARVSLVSFDQRKVLGRQELATYAKLIHVPFRAGAETVKQVPIQLVDSPALSLHSDEEFDSLKRICAVRASLLVLDASSRLQELLRIVERARPLNPKAIAFTRLDSISQYGILYDVLRLTKLPMMGASVSQSFKTPFKFYDSSQLATLILRSRGEK